MKKIKIRKWFIFEYFFIASAVFFLLAAASPASAFDRQQASSLEKQIIDSKTKKEAEVFLGQLREIYFKDNNYSEFVQDLKSLEKKKKALRPLINYHVAYARYQQLRYLESKQAWEEYFSKGNDYKEELVDSAKKAGDAAAPNEPLRIYSRLLLWQFHKDQQDAFVNDALSDLMAVVFEYKKEAADIEPLRQIADALSSAGEKRRSLQLYKVYADKLAASNITEEALADNASGFYKQGNLELAELIYNVYIERIVASLPKEASLPLLVNTAKLFAYKDEGLNDMFYAEKIFAKIEELGGPEIFDEELMYLRSFNLEKAKVYSSAKDLYEEFLRRFPQATHAEESIFKIGIIHTYILRDIKEGSSNFAELAERKESTSPYVILSLYQLGLLSQWQENYPLAEGYYNKLIVAAAGDFTETTALAQERLKEIKSLQPMEYNLKTFLDLSLKEEQGIFNREKLDLKSHPYTAKKGQEVRINSTAVAEESGCLQPELRYLWSGNLGSSKPSLEEVGFSTSYAEAGTKIINLVVVSPYGIIGCSLDLVDVY